MTLYKRKDWFAFPTMKAIATLKKKESRLLDKFYNYLFLA